MISKATSSRAFLAILIGLLSLGLASCEEAPLPSKDDIVGTWVYDEGSTYETEGTNGKVEFKNDGTFELEHIPEEAISQESGSLTSESGTWEILDRERWSNQPRVQITTSGSVVIPRPWRTSFVVEGSGDGRRLIGVVGDPDSADRYILRKK